jgi:hypothetical protein
VWRLPDGTPVGEPLHGHDGDVNTVAVGALPDGTPVIISGGDDEMVRVWRLADGTAVGKPLTGHARYVDAVAVGALPDGTPVIISAGDETVRVRRLADGSPVVPPLNLPESIWDVAVHDHVIVTAAGADIAVHQLSNSQTNTKDARSLGQRPNRSHRIMGCYPVHRRGWREAIRRPDRRRPRDSRTLSGTSPAARRRRHGSVSEPGHRHCGRRVPRRVSQERCDSLAVAEMPRRHR